MTGVLDMSSDLLTTAADLWPGSDVVPAGAPGDGRPVRVTFAVVQRRGDPVALVPVDPAPAAGAALRRFSSASTWWGATSRVVASTAVGLVPGLLRDRVEVRGGDPGLAAHLSEVLGRPITFSVTIGTARVNRKPVLQLFDERGACCGFAKVGWSPSTNLDVAAEGRALTTLGAELFRYVVPPTLIARTTWQDRPVIVIEALEPSVPRPGRRSWDPPIAAMDELCSRFAGAPVALTASAWWSREWQVAGALGDPVDRSRLGRAMDRVALLAGDRPLTFGAWHGDWTPWNMAVDGQRVLLWDWERFEAGVPAGLDELHYAVNALTAGGPATAEAICGALATAAGSELRPGDPARLRSLLYLVAILGRYLRLSGVTGGEHIAPRAAQTLLALERLCDG
jgi:hypothetical protein